MSSIPPQRVIRPTTLYFGTPIVLVTTTQPNGSANITPMSSVWALGDRLVLGLGTKSQGLTNLLRTGEAVVNLPSQYLAGHVERIARTTGCASVPETKQSMGYTFEPDKFRRAQLTSLASHVVAPPRIAECPLQLETVLVTEHRGAPRPGEPDPGYFILELTVVRVHVHTTLTVSGTDHVDVSRWRPLFYVFRHYFGLGASAGKNFRSET